MKKLLFFLLFVMASMSLLGQKRSVFNADTVKLKHSPGYYLNKSGSNMMAGVLCGILAGVVISAAPANTNNQNGQKMYYYGAIGLGIIGFGCEISAIQNLKKAGISLDENGIGIKLKF